MTRIPLIIDSSGKFFYDKMISLTGNEEWPNLKTRHVPLSIPYPELELDSWVNNCQPTDSWVTLGIAISKYVIGTLH